MRKRPEVNYSDFDPTADYTSSELNDFTDALLREDSRSELCRECQGRGQKIGSVHSTQPDALDAEGNSLTVEFPKYECENSHQWFAGEGVVRGIGGENPILFKEHIDSRKRREIHCESGVPDPEIVSGIYNRAHPQGRKINSPEARKRHGASYFR